MPQHPLTGNDPYSEAQHQYLGKDWERYFQFLNGKKLAPQGPGIGQSLGLMGRPGDQDAARTIAANLAIGHELDARGPRDQSLRAMTAAADAMDAQARDKAAIDRAVAIANTPGVSQYGRPIAQREDGSYTTLRPNPAEPQPPVDRNAILRQQLPGHLQAPEPPPPAITFGAPTAAVVNGKRVFVRAGSDGRMYDTARRPIDAAAVAPDGDQNEPLVSIMGPDSRPVLVRRSEAIGKTPASSREQGRPVTSGDAGRISEIDTSLDDLKVLRETLGTTGAGSKIGAMLPNVVTELTTWGADSKSRQGTIDRVKQVIGKALEGGVLRKEDEIKYEKILPTIGDPPDVAKSKLDGLEKALVLRRQRTLESLGDAGYETSRFDARTGAPVPAAAPGAAPPAATTGPVEGTRQPIPNGGGVAEFRGGKWIRVQ